LGDHHARCFSIEFTTLFTANHGVCKNELVVTPTATAANSSAHSNAAYLPPATFLLRSDGAPNLPVPPLPVDTTRSESSARGLLAVPPVLAPRQNSARRLEGAGLLPRGAHYDASH
jgi:hypothetical protein